MCNCGKNRAAAQPRRVAAATTGTTQSFSLVTRDGTTQKFGSRLEADAENARLGYTGIVKPIGGTTS
jgi:hypothetical protein